MDSEVLATPVDLEKVNVNWVSGAWEIVNETSSKGDMWILQVATPVDLETVNENWTTTVFEIVNETDSKGVAWIGQQ